MCAAEDSKNSEEGLVYKCLIAKYADIKDGCQKVNWYERLSTMPDVQDTRNSVRTFFACLHQWQPGPDAYIKVVHCLALQTWI
jgi:hypothetical protein